MRRLREILRREGGYTLVELIAVTAILSVVITALTALFVQGSNGELDMNRRFQAQQTARVALDKLRREVHCSSAISPSGTSSSITITLLSGCPTVVGGVTSVRWCALQVPGAPSGQYGLYRDTTGACATSTGVKVADYLTVQNIFAYSAPTSTSLGSLLADIQVNTKPSMAQETFELKYTTVLRNTLRT